VSACTGVVTDNVIAVAIAVSIVLEFRYYFPVSAI
jgi:hypothetical protein